MGVVSILKGKCALITGSSGFIGSTLCRCLIDEGAIVVVLDNLSYGSKSNIPEECEFIFGDVKNPRSFENLTGDFDYIFHLAAPSSIILFNRDPIGCFNDTVNGFINAISFAKKKGVKKFVYPSSGSIYGTCKPPQKETDIPQPMNLYAVAKLSCEQIAKINKDVNSVGLRIFAGYGPGEEHKGNFASPVTIFLESMLKSDPPLIFGDGTQSRDFVYVDDVVNAFISAAVGDSKGIFNVGSGVSHAFNEVVDMINTLLGTQIRPNYVDKPVNYLENTLADMDFSKNHLSLNYVPLEVGLKKYFRYLKKKGVLKNEKN